MDNMKYMIFLLAVVILVSGCTSTPSIWDPDVVSVKPSHIQQGPDDILIIKDIETLPDSTVLPGRLLYVFYTIANTDQSSTIPDVTTVIYDKFIFEFAEGGEPDQCNKEACTLLPLGEKQIQSRLRAPDSDFIVIATDADLSFKVDYNFSSSLNFPVLLVTEDEILKLMKYEEKIEREVTSTSSAGPIQIRGEIRGRQYLVSGFEASIRFFIRQTGSRGSLKGPIGKGEFVVKFPDDLVSDSSKIVTPNADMFYCEPDGEYISCSNNGEEIDLIDGESSPLIFTIQDISNITVPSITYLIKASVNNYEYEVRDSVGITVVPE